jgi:hypothetical protein
VGDLVVTGEKDDVTGAHVRAYAAERRAHELDRGQLRKEIADACAGRAAALERGDAHVGMRVE